MKKIFLDDIREAPQGWESVHTYNETIQLLNKYSNCPFVMSFDHDLGEEKSGYDVAKYIVEHNLPMHGFVVHSMNSVGSFNIKQLLTHYGYIELR